MTYRIHELVAQSARQDPDAIALIHGDRQLSYADLDQAIAAGASDLVRAGLCRHERVAVYLDKCVEAVVGLLAASAAEGVFVPVNPHLKAGQVATMLADCDARVLITSRQRLSGLEETLSECPGLHTVVLIDEPDDITLDGLTVTGWQTLEGEPTLPGPGGVETDMAAILYTSGSTGRPKGVVLSHRNLIAGAESVSDYLGNTPDDRLLAALPLSFDYGLSQLTTAFRVGASVVLLNYLLPRDVLRAVARHGVTGLAAVPPLWVQLAELTWPAEARQSLRYVTNSGGTMPRRVLDRLREALPATDIVLMYGLTEAFRSTYLPPGELNRRPDSMGIPIPNAEIRVVREDGTECAPDEPGELVHSGPLVALGYWGDPQRTAERFRPLPGQPAGLPFSTMAVWSGDTVRRDSEGYLYFIGRRDEMIKTSGYRVSPGEIEEVVYASGLAGEAAAFGVAHEALGQAIVLVAAPTADGEQPDQQALMRACQQALPAFMVPRHIEVRDQPLPRNPNGKIDRGGLREAFQQRVAEDPA
jgi:acyl-CoA ligase (AMP-forming) (exosortase A-associated)